MTTLGIPNTKLERGNIIEILGKYQFYDKYHELDSEPKQCLNLFFDSLWHGSRRRVSSRVKGIVPQFGIHSRSLGTNF